MSIYKKLIISLIAPLYSTWAIAAPPLLIQSTASPNTTENLKIVRGNQADDFYILASNDSSIQNTHEKHINPTADTKRIIPKSFLAANNNHKIVKINQPVLAKSSISKIKMVLKNNILASSKKIKDKHTHHATQLVLRKSLKHVAVLNKKRHLSFSKKIKPHSREYLAMKRKKEDMDSFLF